MFEAARPAPAFMPSRCQLNASAACQCKPRCDSAILALPEGAWRNLRAHQQRPWPPQLSNCRAAAEADCTAMSAFWKGTAAAAQAALARCSPSTSPTAAKLLGWGPARSAAACLQRRWPRCRKGCRCLPLAPQPAGCPTGGCRPHGPCQPWHLPGSGTPQWPLLRQLQGRGPGRRQPGQPAWPACPAAAEVGPLAPGEPGPAWQRS